MLDKKMILEKAITKHGFTLQHVVAMEEMSELIKEISKYLRGKDVVLSLKEEIADVLIMIEQLRMMHNISDRDIENEINFKLVRINNGLVEDD